MATLGVLLTGLRSNQPICYAFCPWLWPLAQNAKRGRSPARVPDIDQLPVKVASHPNACAASIPPPAPSRIVRTLPATAPITGHLGLGEAA